MKRSGEHQIMWDWTASLKAQKVLARYVLENLDEIARIAKEAEEDLKRIPPWHDPSFDAYVSKNTDRVRAQVQVLFERLQKGKPKTGKYLTYRVEPPDSSQGAQRLRLAREILHYGHSECIGWVLLYAACVAHIRIHPLIIIAKEHAILGYWVNEDDAKANSKIVRHCSADSEIALDRADDRFSTTGPNLLLLRGAHHVRTG